MAGNIFINYRREESGHVAGRLHDSLAPTFGGDKLFMDVDNIPVGRDFEDYLNSQVAVCDAMLAVIGPNWLTAKDETGQRRLDNPEDFVVIEIAAALARNIPVVPVLVDGARMPKASELPESLKPLARRQAIQVRHTNFRSDAEALTKKMREALGHKKSERDWWRLGRRDLVIAAVIVVGGALTWFSLEDVWKTPPTPPAPETTSPANQPSDTGGQGKWDLTGGATPPANQASTPPANQPSDTGGQGKWGPSFDCATDKQPDDIAICNNGRLSQLDLQLNDVYREAINRLGKDQQTKLLEDQKAWVRRRRSCLSDELCLTKAYEGRIAELQQSRRSKY
jgi:uncharacterized protein YecT (DUF1311 family)